MFEWCESRFGSNIISLSDLVRQYQYNNAKIPENDLLNYSRAIIRGLYIAHALDFVHRDASLQNFLLDKNDDVKLCDFGSAKEIHNNLVLSIFSGFSKEEYFPPEWNYQQKLQNTKFEATKQDIYQIGVCIQKLLQCPGQNVIKNASSFD